MANGKTIADGMERWATEIWPRLFRYIYYRVQNREEAEELTQETFERVQPKIIGGLVQQDKIEAYCFIASRNLITEVWRKRVRQPSTVSMDELASKGLEPAQPDRYTELEDSFILESALQQLNNDYRQVLTLRIMEDWPVNEVAKKMKRSPGAVRSLQFRAVQALKELLAKGGYFHESD